MELVRTVNCDITNPRVEPRIPHYAHSDVSGYYAHELFRLVFDSQRLLHVIQSWRPLKSLVICCHIFRVFCDEQDIDAMNDK